LLNIQGEKSYLAVPGKMVAQAAMGALCGPYQDLNPVEYLAAKKQAKDSSNAWT